MNAKRIGCIVAVTLCCSQANALAAPGDLDPSFGADGVGRVQHWGGAIQEIRAGYVVWIPPGVKHWHGAAATTGMTHIAISEALDGKTVEWMEHVSDEQYRR